MHCIAKDSGTPKNRPDVTQKNRHWRKMHLTMKKKKKKEREKMCLEFDFQTECSIKA